MKTLEISWRYERYQCLSTTVYAVLILKPVVFFACLSWKLSVMCVCVLQYV